MNDLPTVFYTCAHCEQPFVADRVRSTESRRGGRLVITRKYCSDDCKRAARRAQPKMEATFDCLHCGKHVEREAYVESWTGKKRWRPVGFYCSQVCRATDAMKVAIGRGEGYVNVNGYFMVTTPDGRQMPEHRYVMEHQLGRKLSPTETVHHRNGQKTDNRPENLELWNSRHCKGQRVDDLVDFAIGILRDYPEFAVAHGVRLEGKPEEQEQLTEELFGRYASTMAAAISFSDAFEYSDRYNGGFN